MSDDLISRQAAIDGINKLMEIHFDRRVVLKKARDVVEQLPPAQPKRGKWLPVDSYSAFGGDEETWMVHGNPVAFYYCSECKEQAYAGEDGESLITKYCPHCGAKMEVTE